MRPTVLVGFCALACAGCAEAEELAPGDPIHRGGSAGTSQPSSSVTTFGSGSGIGGSSGQTVGSTTDGTSGTGQTGGSGPSGGGGGGGAPVAGTGQGGTGGTSGAAGASGSGGGTVMSDAGFVAGMQVLYAVQSTAATSPYIECELHAKNGGTSTVAVSELKLRYYYTNEEVGRLPTLTLNWSHITTGGANQTLDVTSMVNPLTPAKNNADTYVEFSLASASHTNLSPNESADFSWRMNGPNQATDIFTQTNDYSFDVGRTTPQQWDHVVLVRNGTVVWGLPPP
jgi:endoglucanase